MHIVLLLAVVQGLTEFLPVSSSGHLRLGAEFLGIAEPQTFFDIVLHVGTMVSVVVVYWHELVAISRGLVKGKGCGWTGEPGRRFALLVILATIPTAIMGFVFGNLSEKYLATAPVIGVMLLVNGSILAATAHLPEGRRSILAVGVASALVIGVAQGFGIIRGISRSGITISAGLALGLKRDLAASYAFILSLPAIAGALVLKWDASQIPDLATALKFLVGAAVSAIVGVVALFKLKGWVSGGKLHHFSYYCWILGGLTLLVSWLSPS